MQHLNVPVGMSPPAEDGEANVPREFGIMTVSSTEATAGL